MAVNQLARHPVIEAPAAVLALPLASAGTVAVMVVTDWWPLPLLVTVNGRNWVLLVAPGYSAVRVPDQVGVPVVIPSADAEPTVPDPVTEPEPPVKYATAMPDTASTATNATAARRFFESHLNMGVPTFVFKARGGAGPNCNLGLPRPTLSRPLLAPGVPLGSRLPECHRLFD